MSRSNSHSAALTKAACAFVFVYVVTWVVVKVIGSGWLPDFAKQLREDPGLFTSVVNTLGVSFGLFFAGLEYIVVLLKGESKKDSS